MKKVKKCSRLKNIINHNIHANFFGKLYEKDKIFVLKIYKNYIYSLCKIIYVIIGININTIPVLDVLRKNTNKIIGKRSFSEIKKLLKI